MPGVFIFGPMKQALKITAILSFIGALLCGWLMLRHEQAVAREYSADYGQAFKKGSSLFQVKPKPKEGKSSLRLDVTVMSPDEGSALLDLLRQSIGFPAVTTSGSHAITWKPGPVTKEDLGLLSYVSPETWAPGDKSIEAARLWLDQALAQRKSWYAIRYNRDTVPGKLELFILDSQNWQLGELRGGF